MNVLDAAYALVRDYPGGAEALAPRLGKGASTLSHEVDPSYRPAKLGLLDALALTQLSGDHRILTAFAATCGCLLLPLPPTDEIAPNLIAGLGRTVHEFGELLAEVSATMADGTVTATELRRVERETSDVVRALQELLAHVRALHERSRPATLRQVG